MSRLPPALGRIARLTSNPRDIADLYTNRYADLLDDQGGTDIRLNGEFDVIRDFAEGLSRILYGWQDFYLCRAKHNMGSGSKLYSFFGSEATLVNGPVWTDDGIEFDGVSQFINTGLTSGAAGNDLWVYAVVKKLDSNYSAIVSKDNVAGNRSWTLSVSSGSNQAEVFTPDYTIITGTDSDRVNFRSRALIVDNSLTARRFTHNTQISSASLSGSVIGSPAPVLFGARAIGNIQSLMEGIFSFGAVWKRGSFSSNQITQVNALYNSTIGQGVESV